ncbi:MAG: hypothetical protein II942_02590 [Alphaproteobacteria bacterium]|nr:hypothetical protein [Alphaproteobacteria bacterium]
MKKILCAVCMTTALIGLTACGIGDTNTTYDRAQVGRQGQTSVGRIISMTQIEIAGTNEGGGLLGAGVGGALGGVGGSALGGGKGSTLFAIGGAALGALAGAAVGSATEQAATKDLAYEFLVQKSGTNNVVSIVQTNELGLRPGDNVILVTIDGTTRIRAKY